MKKKILVLSKFDSFARVAKRIAEGFTQEGFQVDYRLIAAGRKALSRRVFHEIGLSAQTPVTTAHALFQSGELGEFVAVFLGGTGGFIRDFLRRLNDFFPEGKPRTLTIAGYPGVILREKLSGFANRCGCDFVLLNSPADLKDYQRFCLNYGLNASGARLFGYAFPHFHAAKKESIRRVLFVEQSAIPSSRRERLYLIQQLAFYAKKYPHREVIIKPRLLPGEKSVFTTRHHMEFLMRALPDLPKNLRVDYGAIQQHLEESDLCLTLSSTVALQAMWYGIPTGIIRDFGVQDEYGTDFFRESGCLISFDDLAKDNLPTLRPDWFSRHFADCGDAMHSLAESVKKEYERREQLSDWKNNGNLNAVFSDSYLHFREEKSKFKILSAYWWNYFIYYSKALFQALRRGKEQCQ